MARKGDVEGLIDALSYGDVVADRDGRQTDLGIRTRQEAAAALGEHGDDSAVDPLVTTLLRDQSQHVRVASVRALSHLRWPSAIEPLARVVAALVGDDSKWLRTEAIQALVEIGDPSAAVALAEHLVHRDEPPRLTDSDREAFEAMPGSDLGGTNDHVISRLVDCLAEADEAVHARAAEILRWLREASLDPLLEALRDDQRRAGAVVALGALHDARAVGPLVDVLDDPDPEVRRRVAWSLGELHDPIAVESLIRVTRDENYEVRVAAGQALDRLGSVAVVLGVAAFVRPMLANSGAAERAPDRRSLPESTDAVPGWLRPVLHKLIAEDEPGGETNGAAR
jgi:HEAT repeat protein